MINLFEEVVFVKWLVLHFMIPFSFLNGIIQSRIFWTSGREKQCAGINSLIQVDSMGGAIAITFQLFGGGRIEIVNKILLFFYVLTYCNEKNVHSGPT